MSFEPDIDPDLFDEDMPEDWDENILDEEELEEWAEEEDEDAI